MIRGLRRGFSRWGAGELGVCEYMVHIPRLDSGDSHVCILDHICPLYSSSSLSWSRAAAGRVECCGRYSVLLYAHALADRGNNAPNITTRPLLELFPGPSIKTYRTISLPGCQYLRLALKPTWFPFLDTFLPCRSCSSLSTTPPPPSLTPAQVANTSDPHTSPSHHAIRRSNTRPDPQHTNRRLPPSLTPCYGTPPRPRPPT